MNCVSFYRKEGYYNLCNTNEKSAQYVFDWGKWEHVAKELKLKRSYLISLDEDRFYTFPEYDAIDLATELSDIINGYWINSDKQEINKVLNFLYTIQEENKVEMCKDMIEKYCTELDKWKQKLVVAEKDLVECR